MCTFNVGDCSEGAPVPVVQWMTVVRREAANNAQRSVKTVLGLPVLKLDKVGTMNVPALCHPCEENYFTRSIFFDSEAAPVVIR